QADQKIVASGYVPSDAFPGVGGIGARRLNPDGSFDGAVGPGGYALAVQPDGKVIAGIDRIMRTNPEGTPDSSFVTSHSVNEVRAFLVQPDGKILVAGYLTQVQGQPRDRIARLEANGEVDLGFDSSGG